MGGNKSGFPNPALLKDLGCPNGESWPILGNEMGMTFYFLVRPLGREVQEA